MHTHAGPDEALTDAVLHYAVHRMRLHPPPLDHPRPAAELAALAGPTVTPHGIGGHEALRIFGEVLAPACISVDHPRFFSFVPGAPTDASILFDLVLAASNVYGGSWLEGAGVVFAENEALRWIVQLLGFPDTAGGVFVSGGTAGNLSALVAARYRWRRDAGGRHDRTRPLFLASAGCHSSIASAARVLDADVVEADGDERGRSRREHLDAVLATLSPEDRDRVCAVVVTGGTTNAGVVDDLAAAADIAETLGTWLHVDGAYGGAALCAPSVRPLFTGVERADSFIVDPHKWLFAPFDCCALVYRDPDIARAAHTQHAEYLDVLHAEPEWNPSDFAHHLSRRARGLPFWFSLATLGTDAYTEAVEATLTLTRWAARAIDDHPRVELLMEPELSVLLFRRPGWTPEDYQRWSDELLLSGTAFVVPTAWRGETVLRFCFVNPITTTDDVAMVLATL
jgi:glutamate/tyrosine decarboxylase-like PLP-dependent enzyme